ncbi:MAG TPA: C40 family peptidase [Chitinophagaceae bacterium]
MKLRGTIIGIVGLFAVGACNWQVPSSDEGLVDTLSTSDTLMAKDSLVLTDSVPNLPDSSLVDRTANRDTTAVPPGELINTGSTTPEQLMAFAETLKGVPYKYASTDPKVGFDCSGFITYVFNHFSIKVPRSSIDFTDVGKYIPKEQAKRGDIILFTGTDSTERFVGHMGLITSNNGGKLEFIHSTSGKAYSVTVTTLNDYYLSRFVKCIRIFPQNDQ